MKKKVKIPEPVDGFGWVGTWADGVAGWGLPDHIHRMNRRGNASGLGRAFRKFFRRPKDRAFLCKITVTPVLDKLGRPITRVVK